MKDFHIKNIKYIEGVSNRSITVKSDLDLNGVKILNNKIPESENALASTKTVNNNSKALEQLFTKDNNNIFPVNNQKASASSQYAGWGHGSNPSNAFDNNSSTQWNTGMSGKRS